MIRCDFLRYSRRSLATRTFTILHMETQDNKYDSFFQKVFSLWEGMVVLKGPSFGV